MYDFDRKTTQRDFMKLVDVYTAFGVNKVVFIKLYDQAI